jgi:cytochrome c556
MKTMLSKVLCVVIIVAFWGIYGCGGEAPQKKQQESKLDKMKPKPEDRLSTLMDRGWDNLTYILYGFMNFDNEKIKTGTQNIYTMSPYMAQRIGPQYKEYTQEWKNQCAMQQEYAQKLAQHFEEKDFENARESLHKLIEMCMECHKIYRKHLLESEFE